MAGPGPPVPVPSPTVEPDPRARMSRPPWLVSAAATCVSGIAGAIRSAGNAQTRGFPVCDQAGVIIASVRQRQTIESRRIKLSQYQAVHRPAIALPNGMARCEGLSIDL